MAAGAAGRRIPSLETTGEKLKQKLNTDIGTAVITRIIRIGVIGADGKMAGSRAMSLRRWKRGNCMHITISGVQTVGRICTAGGSRVRHGREDAEEQRFPSQAGRSFGQLHPIVPQDLRIGMERESIMHISMGNWYSNGMMAWIEARQ